MLQSCGAGRLEGTEKKTGTHFLNVMRNEQAMEATCIFSMIITQSNAARGHSESVMNDVRNGCVASGQVRRSGTRSLPPA